MKNKKSQPLVDTSHMTQFVADIPMESVIMVLESLPRFDVKAISSPMGLYTFEVRFNNSSSKVPIYLSLQPWNKTETLLTLSYYRPKHILTSLSHVIIFVLMACLSVAVLFINAAIGMLIIGVILFALLIYGRSNGNTTMDDDYSFDAQRLRTQEDLMGWIVADLQDSADLEIVAY